MPKGGGPPPKRTPTTGTPRQLDRQAQAYKLYIMGASTREIAKALQITWETAAWDISLERARLGEAQHAINREAMLMDRVRSIDEAKRVVHTIASDPRAEHRDRVAAAKAVGDLEMKAATLARLDEAKKVSVSGDIGVTGTLAPGSVRDIGERAAVSLLAALGALRRAPEDDGARPVGPGHLPDHRGGDGPGGTQGDTLELPAEAPRLPAG